MEKRGLAKKVSQLNEEISKNMLEESKAMLETSQISLKLDDYEEIFSDFDPRTHSKKALSDDFLNEIRKASIDKIAQIELKLLLPKGKRDFGKENVIKRRLHEHFKRHYFLIKEDIGKGRKRGLFFMIFGLALMSVATYISLLNSTKFMIHLIFVLLEPAGWFITWYGLDEIFYTPRIKKKGPGFL